MGDTSPIPPRRSCRSLTHMQRLGYSVIYKMKKLLSWFGNYWYYYKWRVIFAAFFIVAVGIMISQMVGKVEYDVNILYAGPHIYQLGEKEKTEEIFRGLMPKDYNGDGKKTVLLANMTIMTNEQIKEALEKVQKDGATVMLNQYSSAQMDKAFTHEIFAGESVICLLDPLKYEQVKEKSGFLPLSEAIGYKPDNAIDDYGIKFSDTAVGVYFDLFKELPEDTILCVRHMSTASVFTGAKKVKEKYAYSLDFFKHLVEFKP